MDKIYRDNAGEDTDRERDRERTLQSSSDESSFIFGCVALISTCM